MHKFYRKITLLSIILILTVISCKSKSAQNGDQEPKAIDLKINYAPINAENKQHWTDIVGTFYNSIMKPKLNGQFLVAKNGQILFEAYNGKENLYKDSSKNMNEHSAIHLASVSKTFTGGATLLLEQQGKLKLDDAVAKYLPTFPYKDVTIKMLLNHRAGLPDYTHLLWDWGWPKHAKATNTDILNYMVKANALQIFKTNTRFDYCNTNYVMLALVIEAASKKSYSDYLQHNIFKPLGMNDTYVFQAKDTATAIPSYDRRKRIYEYNELDLTYGDKNIYSTVRDLYKWDQAWYTDQLIDTAHRTQAYSGYSFEKPGVKNYGLGWRMLNFTPEQKIIFHNGWWHGNNNAFIRLFQDSAVFICLGNVNAQSNYAPMQLSYLFGNYPFEYSDDEKKDTADAAKEKLLIQLKAKADSLKLVSKPILPKPKKDSTAKKDTTKMILNDKKKKDSLTEKKKQ